MTALVAISCTPAVLGHSRGTVAGYASYGGFPLPQAILPLYSTEIITRENTHLGFSTLTETT